MGKRVLQCAIVLAVVGLCVPAFAQGGAAVSEGAKIDKNAVEAAVKKACDWLKSQQKPDGSWTGANHYDTFYPYASTAFVTFALLKGTESGESGCVKKAFDYLRKKEFPGVYGVSSLILALCALFEPQAEPEPEEQKEVRPGEKLRTTLFEPRERMARRKLEDAPPWVNEWLKSAVAWLVSQQAVNIWRYPGTGVGDYAVSQARGGNQDASNTQYAMLALHEASILGVNAPLDVYGKVADYFIVEQEKDGPDVKPFPVPAADLPINKLKEMEKEILKKLKQEHMQAVKEGKPGLSLKDLGPRTTEEMGDPYKDFGAELSPMKARGWAYLPQGTPTTGATPVEQWQVQATGSMTAGGAGTLIICKSKLEGTNWYMDNDKKLRQAIRDGMAWLSHKFTVTDNPGPLGCWKYYYLYGLERAGVLSLTRKIGDHFWYEEGGKHILATQGGDGSWPGTSVDSGDPHVKSFDYGPIWPTCFCILFLKKATAPVVNLPEPTTTGEGLFGPARPKDK